MKRSIIKIDEEKCTGCGLCIPNCPEGAIQIIDDKARLISDLLCDGLGACLGHCPEGAIEVEEREAEPYDERKVIANIVEAGPNTIRAHLAHLKEHNQIDFYNEAIDYLNENNIPVPENKEISMNHSHQGCPGSRAFAFDNKEETVATAPADDIPSALTHWPIQLHLMSPVAPHYQESDVLIAADCVAFSLGNFHSKYLKGKTLTIACPKLDDGQDIYQEKIKSLIDDAKVNTITVMIMQVPCCGGLLHTVQQAASKASRKCPIKCLVVGLQGEILKEEWV